MKQSQSQSKNGKNQSALVTVFSILLFLLVLVVFGIQISIIISYFVMMNYGRCVYTTDDDNTCYCDYTTKKQCDNLNGVYNNQLGCDSNVTKDCIQKRTTPSPPSN